MTSRQSLNTRLRKHLGLIVELDLIPTTGMGDSSDNKSAFRSHCNLAAGWYMLSVYSGSESMGAGLDLHFKDHTASLQLGVTGLSRRIVYIRSRLKELGISIDREMANRATPERTDIHIELSRLSRGFALDRMKKKCRRTVSYESYDKFMRAFREEPDYGEWLLRHPDGGSRLPQNPDRESSNDALLITSDEIILHEDAEAILLTHLNANPQVQLCYSDHQLIDTSGQALHGVMKPSWDITLLQSGNYIGRVFSCTRALFEKLGGLDDSLGNSKEYDFLMRASHVLTTDDVLRIPAVLYSARKSKSKDQWFSIGENDRQVLEQYWQSRIPEDNLRPRIIPATVPSLFRTRWPLPDPAPDVDIIIPTRDREPILRACVESILKLTVYPNYHIRVMDNDSAEPGFFSFKQALDDEPRVSFTAFPGEFNYSAINNAAVRESSADIVVLLNNDTEVIDGRWLEELVAQARQATCGCVGARLLYANSRVQHAGIVMGMKGLAGHVNRFASDRDSGYLHKLCLAHQTSAVTAACLAIRRDVFINSGGFDEEALQVAFNDVDLCLRVASHGYDNVLLPFVTLLHHESVSRGADDSPAKAARFKRECETLRQRWLSVINNDPYWNPNLSLDSEKPTYAAE